MEKHLWGGVFSETEKSEKIRKFIDSFRFDWILCRENFDITLVHALVLSQKNIISKNDVSKILKSKEEIVNKIINTEKSEFEDVHSAIEFFISQKVSEDVGANLRLGRSRNEEVITSTYLWILRKAYELSYSLEKISRAIIDCAEKNFGKIAPFFTHERQAQPVLFSHLILSYHEGFLRCVERFADSLKRFDVCHLGSGAGTGTSIEIDVKTMAKILGFSRISQNSIDSTGRRDNIAELIFVFSTFSLLFSKISDDLIFLSSENLGFVEISEKLCTGSSMMPQKKNPDTLEVIRSKYALFLGHLISAMTLEKGLISGYSKDLQDDKRILFASMEEFGELCGIIPEVFYNITARSKPIPDYTLATDLAEKLVLFQKMSYREAHRFVGEKLKKGEKITDITVEESLSMKKTPQSTNPEFVKNQIKNHTERSRKIFRYLKQFLSRFTEEEFTRRINEYLK